MIKENQSIRAVIDALIQKGESLRTKEDRITATAKSSVNNLNELNITSDLGKVIKEFSKSSLEKLSSGDKLTSTEISAQQFEIKQMKKLIINTDSKEEKAQLEEMLSVQSKLLKDNKSQSNALVDTFTKNIGLLSGAVIGMFSESPLLAIMASGAVDQTKKMIENRKSQKAELSKQTTEIASKLENITKLNRDDIDNKKEDNNKSIEDSREKKVGAKKRDGVFVSMNKHLEAIRMFLVKEKAPTVSGLSALSNPSKKLPISQRSAKPINQSTNMNKGMLAGLAAFFGSMMIGIKKALPKLIKRIGIILLKFNPIALILGTLASGLDDALKTYNNTGSISKALSSMFGGIVEFITFGLVSKEDVENVLNPIFSSISSAIDSIVEGFKSIFNGISAIWNDDTMSVFDKVIGTIKITIMKWVGYLTSIGDMLANAVSFIGEFTGINVWLKNMNREIAVLTGFDISNEIDKVIKTIKKWFNDAIQSVKNFSLMDIINGVDIVSTTKSVIKDIKKMMSDDKPKVQYKSLSRSRTNLRRANAKKAVEKSTAIVDSSTSGSYNKETNLTVFNTNNSRLEPTY